MVERRRVMKTMRDLGRFMIDLTRCLLLYISYIVFINAFEDDQSNMDLLVINHLYYFMK